MPPRKLHQHHSSHPTDPRAPSTAAHGTTTPDPPTQTTQATPPRKHTRHRSAEVWAAPPVRRARPASTTHSGPTATRRWTARGTVRGWTIRSAGRYMRWRARWSSRCAWRIRGRVVLGRGVLGRVCFCFWRGRGLRKLCKMDREMDERWMSWGRRDGRKELRDNVEEQSSGWRRNENENENEREGQKEKGENELTYLTLPIYRWWWSFDLKQKEKKNAERVETSHCATIRNICKLLIIH